MVIQDFAKRLFNRKSYRALSVMLLVVAFLLSSGMGSVRSQLLPSKQTSHLEFKKIKELYSTGNYYKACENLLVSLGTDMEFCTPNEILDQNQLEIIKLAIYRQPQTLHPAIYSVLGDVMGAIGKLESAKYFLTHGLELKGLLTPETEAAMHLNLGNILRASGNLNRDRLAPPKYDYLPWKYESAFMPKNDSNEYKKIDNFYSEAITEYQQSELISDRYLSSTNSLLLKKIKLKSKLNHLSLSLERGKAINIPNLDFSFLPNDRERVYARINLARSLAFQLQNSYQPVDAAIDQMKIAVQDSQDLGNRNDRRIESYAMGNLGSLYEYLAQTDKQYIEKAQQITRQAMSIGQPSEMPDVAYQWQWQLGRLYQLENNQQEAIAAYKGAVNTLKFARKNLLAVNSDFQFSFRDNIEPLYRELTTLLLKIPNQNSLNEAVKTTDDLQLAELENFLRCNLSKSNQVDQGIDKLDENAVFIYPIILKDSLELVYKTPREPFKHVHPRKDEKISHSEIEKTIKDLQIALVHPSGEDDVQKYGQMLYRWLIQPIKLEMDGTLTSDKTLVFVLDGDLKNIPMAVLYNREMNRYLIEEYPLAVVPSRQLFESRPRQKKLDVLLAGVSKMQSNIEGKKYKELKFVSDELEGIRNIIKSPHQLLLDDKFTKEEFSRQVPKFPIIHIATHGAFSSDPNETYILAWGERIRGKEIEQTTQVKNSSSENKGINLLILSACETAQGNRRATLGLAGIAAKSRVRSTIATLWQVNDPSTASFMKGFYQELQKNSDTTLSKALQSVQVRLIQDGYTSPHYWAPFILVGNWL